MSYEPKPGILLIPDIGGYTEFLNEVELTHSSHIVTELLESLLESLSLPLLLSEVEGDALLFFQRGELPPLDALRDQVRRWLTAFHSKLNLMRRDSFCHCGACNFIGNMTLKVVGHYGEIGVQRVGALTNLIGKDVVLTHRLLKNSVTVGEYFIFSKALWEAVGAPELDSSCVEYEEEYPVFGRVPMICLDYSHIRRELPRPPPRDEVPPQQESFSYELQVQASLETAAAVLSDIDRRLEWIEGIRELHWDPTEPLAAGHHHLCVIGNQRLDQYLQGVHHDAGTFRIAHAIRPPRAMFKAIYNTFEATRTDDGIRLTVVFAYTLQPLLGWMSRLFGLPRMRRIMHRSLVNLKALLEAVEAAEAAEPPPATGSAPGSPPPAAGPS